jgi:hypothetical protein
MPILLIYSKENGDSRLEAAIHLLYTTMPRIPSNTIIRFMERRMLRGKKDIMNNARRGQALLQIFNDYCANNEDGCFGCTLKKSLRVLDS